MNAGQHKIPTTIARRDLDRTTSQDSRCKIPRNFGFMNKFDFPA